MTLAYFGKGIDYARQNYTLVQVLVDPKFVIFYLLEIVCNLLFLSLERMTGVEPATSCLEGRCSSQLNYIRKGLWGVSPPLNCLHRSIKPVPSYNLYIRKVRLREDSVTSTDTWTTDYAIFCQEWIFSVIATSLDCFNHHTQVLLPLLRVFPSGPPVLYFSLFNSSSYLRFLISPPSFTFQGISTSPYRSALPRSKGIQP